ncbi:hypothetical protein niasHT_004384 [Heterodera trifolii]|uniref:Uncharacterized protein n=1 Tax=Heterodera trifolii TaxID=157864 RepID=A0ABD2MFA7_9BILA
MEKWMKRECGNQNTDDKQTLCKRADGKRRQRAQIGERHSTQEINASPVKKPGMNDDHQKSDQRNARAFQNDDDHQPIDQINARALQNEDNDQQQQAKGPIFAENPLIDDQQWAEPVVHSESASNQFLFQDLFDPVELETDQDWNDFMSTFYQQSSALDQNVDLALQSDQQTPFYHQSSAFDQNQCMAQQMDQHMIPNSHKSSAIDQNQSMAQQRDEHITPFYQQSNAIDQNQSSVQQTGRMLMRQTSRLSANDQYMSMARQRDQMLKPPTSQLDAIVQNQSMAQQNDLMLKPSTSQSNAIDQNQSMAQQNDAMLKPSTSAIVQNPSMAQQTDHLVPGTINQSNAADNNPSTSNTKKCQFSKDATKTKNGKLLLKPVNCHNVKQQKGKTTKDPIKPEGPVEKRKQKRHKKAEDQTDVEQLDMGSFLTVVEIQQIFWRIMLSFGALPEHLNEQQIEQIIKNLIDPKKAEKIKEMLRQLLLIENCLIDKQLFLRINHEISFVFGSPLFNNNNLHEDNNEEETHEKLLLFTIRILRILLGFLDAPYERFENVF